MSFLNSVIAPVFFPSVLWRTGDAAVHLTFDDGPHPSATPKVLEILEKRKIHATFFLVGNSVRQYPTIAREISSSGHAIGSHALSHESLFMKSVRYQRDQIHGANVLFEDILNTRPRFFRPPFGYFDHRTLKTAREEGLRVVMWNLDPQDFNPSRWSDIVPFISRRIRSGSIVLLHDNDKTAAVVSRYLDPLLDTLIDRGFQFSSLLL